MAYVIYGLMKSVTVGEAVGSEAVFFCVVSVLFLAAIVWLVWSVISSSRRK